MSSTVSRPSNAIDILQHWTAEGVDPLASVVEEFQRSHGEARVQKHAEHVTSLRLIVKSQILREDPPDLWVEWPGKNLQMSVDAGVTADITDVWEEAGLTTNYVESAQEAARFDGRYHCLPTDVYRINNLFYNVEMVERAGVDVDSVDSPAAFVEMLARLDDELDVAPMVVNGRDPFGPLQLWETLVIAHGGAAAYDELLAGHGERHRETVRQACESLRAILEYVPDDATFTSSEGADRQFVEGQGAVTHNGGWAIGRMKQSADFEYGSDWECRPFPGTDDVFQMNMNAVVPAARVEGDETVSDFLAHLGSSESLQHVNNTLGAVPPRTDVRTESLHPVIQAHYDALETTRAHVDSMAHGLGVRPEQVIDLKSAAGSFVEDRDVDAMTRTIVESL